jgi:hypothetical protein
MQSKKLWVLVKSFLVALPIWLLIVGLFLGLSTDFEADRFMALGSMPEVWLSTITVFLPVFTLTLWAGIAAYRGKD